MKVLVTGGGGWTAAAIVEALRQRGHDPTAFDLAGAAPNGVPCIAGDVADGQAVDGAARGMDAIVHLAAVDGQAAPDRAFAVNVKGTYNAFAAARAHRVARIVLMSSAWVHLPGTDPVDAASPWRSAPGGDHLYDLTKRLQEEIARDFCQTFGMRCVALRAGHIVDGRRGGDPQGRLLGELDYCRGGWVCRYDLASAVVAAVAADVSGFNLYHAVGAAAARGRFDVARTERELGCKFAMDFAQYD